MADEKEQSFAFFMELPELVQYNILAQTELVPTWGFPIEIASRSRVEHNKRPSWPRKSTAPTNHRSLCVCQLCAIQPPFSFRAVTNCPACIEDRGTPRTVRLGWHFSINIFLVSRHVNRLAKSVFFSQNRFILWDNSGMPLEMLGITDDSEFVYLDLTLRKLRQIPLASFRWLELRLEYIRPSENAKDGIAYKLWHELADLINNVTLVGRLTLVIDFSFMNSEYFGIDTDENDIWKAYQNIAGAFKYKERRLKNFFVHLSDPGLSYYETDIVRWTRERKLEKLVMNNEDYDSASRGKYRHSWLDESSGPRMHFRHLLRYFDLDQLDDRDPEVRQALLDDGTSIHDKYGHEYHTCPSYMPR